jgi:hypothetical protein
MGGSTGTLVAEASDQPGDIQDFETLVLSVTSLYVKPSDGEREEVDVDDTEIDLVELQGDASQEVGSTDLETGEYEFLQLEIGEVVEATLDDGSSASVSTPGEAPLKFEESFEIREGETTRFIADFTPVKQGQSGGYVLQPVADEVEVIYEEDETPTPTP